MPGMIIEVDTREQKPYMFKDIKSALPFKTLRTTLKTGDYRVGPSALVCEEAVIVERKSLADLYSTLGSGRDRFEAEFARMEQYGYAVLMIEAEWSQILLPNNHLMHPTRMNPKSVLATLQAWSQRFGVHIHTAPGRIIAERFTFRILERWYRDADWSRGK